MFYQQFEINTTSIITLYEPYDEQSSYYTGTFRSLPNGVKDEINLTLGTQTQNIAHDSDISGTDYDTLDTTTYTNVDVVKTTAFSSARAGTTAKDGMTRYYDKNGVELSEVAQADIDNAESVGKYYWGSDKKLYIIVEKESYEDIAAARTGLGTTRLIYQLATPVLSYPRPQQLNVSPGDTMMWLNLVEDYGFYNNGLTITDTTIPIKALTKVIKFDKQTGAETNIALATCTVAANGLSFTSTALANDDLVWFEYEYDSALSTVPAIAETHAVNLIANVKSLNDSIGRLDDKVDSTAWQMQTQINEVNADVDVHVSAAAPHSGHETPAGAQAKADAVQANLNSHTAEKATEQNYGHVKVDGETITASNGIISAQTQIEDTVTSDKWKWGMEDGIVFLEKVVV